MNDVFILKTVKNVFDFRKNINSNSIGFVPTMGALHKGHQSMIDRSVQENDFTIISIFVNPTQFNNSDDLLKYPKTWEQDLALVVASGADAIFVPDFDQIYADEYKFKITETDFSTRLCGKSRPGHFDGVLTVVMRLLNIIQPTRVYFGEKDFQQMTLVQNMIDAFFVKTQLVPCPTVREKSGLAMSSRNTRLSDQGLQKAAQIYTILSSKADIEGAKMQLKEIGFEIDYLEEIGGRRFVAVFLEGIRLIDNVKI